MLNEKVFHEKDTHEKDSGVVFYTIEDLMSLLGWSRVIVQKLFNDPKFPAADFGKKKVVEKNALMKYFSVRHEKKYDNFWRRK